MSFAEPPSVAGNLLFLQQGIDLLERINDRLYSSSYSGWSPVGAQYRHVVEHYLSLLDGLDSGAIDYDLRARDATLESSREAALAATRAARDAVRTLENLDRPLRIHMDSGGTGPDWRASSLGRELQFLSSHTVHHFALIRLLLLGLGHETEPDFGVAPSTIARERASR